MTYRRKASRNILPEEANRIPKESFFFRKVVPALLALMALLTAGLILFALGILFGLITF